MKEKKIKDFEEKQLEQELERIRREKRKDRLRSKISEEAFKLRW